MFTNYGREQMTLVMGGSITDIPEATLIGTGSGVEVVTQSGLITPVDRQSFTDTTYPSAQSVRKQTDWNSVEMSGIQLQEFGMTGSGSGAQGLVWDRNALPALTFNGTNELRVESTTEVF